MAHRNSVVFSVVTTLVVAAFSASAHHGSNISYHTDQTMTIAGTVTEWEFANPHPQIYFEVKNDQGKVERWATELLPTPAMLRNMKVGWSRTTLKPGDQIVLVCNPPRAEGAKACLAKELKVNGKDWPVAPGGGGAGSSEGERQAVMRGLAPVTVAAAFALILRAQTTGDFDPHDLSGHWNRTSRFQTFSNVWSGQGPTQGTEEAPLTQTGKASFDQNKPGYGPRAVPPANGNDPMGTCDPLGIPRLLNTEVISPHQTMEIVQVAGRMIQFFEWHHDWREVFTDGRALPPSIDVDPSWNGTSVGRWDGDVFVVNSTGFDERTWLDKFGYPHSENMRLEERYRRRDRDTLELTMTLTDPETYTRPWVSDTKVFRIDREKSKRWDEQIYCVPTEEYRFNERVRDVAGGKESK